jgi:cellulose synthase operon protein C
MRSSRRPLPLSRRRNALRVPLCLATLLLTLAAPDASAAQSLQQIAPSAPTPASTLREAARAWREGRYDSVDELTAAIADDPDAVLLRARAAIARGRYDQARAWLGPMAAAGPTSPAALELGLLEMTLGRRDEAARLLEPLLRQSGSADDALLGRAARAAAALGHARQANDLFRDAAALAGYDPELQTAWGELLVEKHNDADAARSFRAAIQADRRNAPALLGLGRTMAETNPAVARQLAERALSINASLVPAHVFLAELALDERDLQTAAAALERALAVNPSSLEARSLKAAIAWLEDRAADFDAEVAAVLAINPRYGKVYRVAGTHAARHYRFDDAVTQTRRGLAIDPDDSRAYAELGMHLLRTGDEPGARVALERAFRDDPFDVVTYNLLGLLDTLDTFVTIEDGPVVMRLHPDEAAVLREHALPLAKEALSSLGERYGFTPQGPVLIEIFPRHDDFAVRNLGLPGMIGALGACFGRVVTLDSPRARPPGTFNWQATLWHELAHVVTLQLSRQRVPRWLTEGISVYEEQRRRPEWGRDMQLRFVEAMRNEEVIPLADLNQGFSSPETISLAYYQASLVVDHIVAAHGEQALKRLLVAYGEGLDTDAAVQQALGVGLAALQQSFSASLERQFGPLRAALEPPPDGELAGQTSLETLQALARAYPRSYPVQMALARALHEADEIDAAIAAWEAADALVPVATGEDSPLALIAQAAEGSGDKARAAAALERLLAREDANITAARQLVTLLDSSSQRPRLLAAHARVAALDPFDAVSHTVLGRQALAADDFGTAAKWFRVALAAGSRDPVSAHCDLAEAYWRLGDAGDAKRQALAALEIAPTYARAQDLLITIVDGQP